MIDHAGGGFARQASSSADFVHPSELTIHFLRRPSPRAMTATAEILKAGTRLVHDDVRIFTDGEDGPVCHATGSYAVPPASATTR